VLFRCNAKTNDDDDEGTKPPAAHLLFQSSSTRPRISSRIRTFSSKYKASRVAAMNPSPHRASSQTKRKARAPAAIVSPATAHQQHSNKAAPPVGSMHFFPWTDGVEYEVKVVKIKPNNKNVNIKFINYPTMKTVPVTSLLEWTEYRKLALDNAWQVTKQQQDIEMKRNSKRQEPENEKKKQKREKEQKGSENEKQWNKRNSNYWKSLEELDCLGVASTTRPTCNPVKPSCSQRLILLILQKTMRLLQKLQDVSR